MPRTPKISQQTSFEDVPLADPDGRLVDMIGTVLANKDATKRYNKARKDLKTALPPVARATRFMVGERFIVSVDPYDAEGIEIPGGQRLRMKITEQA